MPHEMTASSKRRSSQVNAEITISTVRVEVRHGPSLGVMRTTVALAEARQRGVDLVLQAPLADPPMCEIMDMSRYIYNDEIAAHAMNAAPPTVDPVSTLPIPSKSKGFLTEGGLPERFIEFRIDFDRAGLVRLDRYAEWWRRIERVAFADTCRRLERKPGMWRYFSLPHPVDLARYYRLGEMDIGNTLCIERDSGNIVSIDIAGFDGYSPQVFINSDVMSFGQFITMFTEAQEADWTTIRARLAALDPSAMEDRDQGFWSTLVEEFEAGM
jgi:Translation initiation factor IF-3, N-terminal domain/SUKH-4 immunity protein